MQQLDHERAQLLALVEASQAGNQPSVTACHHGARCPGMCGLVIMGYGVPGCVV